MPFGFVSGATPIWSRAGYPRLVNGGMSESGLLQSYGLLTVKDIPVRVAVAALDILTCVASIISETMVVSGRFALVSCLPQSRGSMKAAELDVNVVEPLIVA